MATRFYLSSQGTAIAVTPNAGWEQVGGAAALRMVPKFQTNAIVANVDVTQTIPITTTQDILSRQWIGDPMPAQNFLSGTTVSLVIRCAENASTNNATLAVVVRVVSQDGSIERGVLFSVFGTGSEFANIGAPETRIVNAQAITPMISLPGDRMVVEVGAHATGPTAAGSFTLRRGNGAATDYALTSGLTTDLNPWFEISQNIFQVLPNNYQNPRADSGISVAERVR